MRNYLVSSYDLDNDKNTNEIGSVGSLSDYELGTAPIGLEDPEIKTLSPCSCFIPLSTPYCYI